MSKKTIIMLFAGVGMTIGGVLPLLWGGDPLGGWSILLGMLGGFIGIGLGVKVSKQL